jgi:hypothetical protein
MRRAPRKAAALILLLALTVPVDAQVRPPLPQPPPPAPLLPTGNVQRALGGASTTNPAAAQKANFLYQSALARYQAGAHYFSRDRPLRSPARAGEQRLPVEAHVRPPLPLPPPPAPPLPTGNVQRALGGAYGAIVGASATNPAAAQEANFLYQSALARYQVGDFAAAEAEANVAQGIASAPTAGVPPPSTIQPLPPLNGLTAPGQFAPTPAPVTVLPDGLLRARNKDRSVPPSSTGPSSPKRSWITAPRSTPTSVATVRRNGARRAHPTTSQSRF